MHRNYLALLLLPTLLCLGNEPEQSALSKSEQQNFQRSDPNLIRSLQFSIEVNRDNEYDEHAWNEMVSAVYECGDACYATENKPLALLTPQAVALIKILLAYADQKGFQCMFDLAAEEKIVT